MESERCTTGNAEVCAALFLDPDRVNPAAAQRRRITRLAPAIYAGTSRSSPFTYLDDAFLLSDLEAEFGRDAFQRFWTSDQNVRAAFETAFGVDPGTWIVGRLDARGAIEHATPAPRPATAFGSLLLISTVTGLGVLVQRRRQVG